MFGHRSDGKIIKSIDPLTKIMPHIMKERNDAHVLAPMEIECSGMDEFIFAQRALGHRFTYMDLVLGSLVRVFANRPKLNRFVVNGRFYKRNDIQFSFVVKKELKDTGEETTVKLTFDGTENIYDVQKKIEEAVLANKVSGAENDTDKLAKALTIVPHGVIKFMVNFLMWMDRHGILPKSIIDISPFHTSLFLTNMKSIKMGYVYHHIYNFGTCSVFLSMGKERYVPVVLDPDTGTLGAKKMIMIGGAIDERITDGLYNSYSIREFVKYLSDPSLLLEKLDHKVEDVR
jgi:hypothetical protein